MTHAAVQPNASQWMNNHQKQLMDATTSQATTYIKISIPKQRQTHNGDIVQTTLRYDNLPHIQKDDKINKNTDNKNEQIINIYIFINHQHI
jgi:hypothetical protein